MPTDNVYAVILAGGNGERFWPLSTPQRPKQFVTIFGGKSLIRQAVDRLDGLIPPSRILVITANRLVAQTRKVLPMIPESNIVGEPCRRDTAAAVAVACGLVRRFGGDDAIGCVLTADQLMEPVTKFRQTLKDAIAVAAEEDAVVTMGIAPNGPSTAFGYIECAAEIKTGTKTSFAAVKRFVEKPDEKTARKYLASGNFLWNSGMFIWRASVMQRAFYENASDIAPLIEAVATARMVKLTLAKMYPATRSISVDYAVMEKLSRILVARAAFKWDDVGSWTSLQGRFPADEKGNVRVGVTSTLDVSGSIVVSEDSHHVALLGVKDVVVVHTREATLVCAKDRVQDLKMLLAQPVKAARKSR